MTLLSACSFLQCLDPSDLTGDGLIRSLLWSFELTPASRRSIRETERDTIRLTIVCQLVVCIFTRPTGSPKYGTTRKNTPRYYTTKRLIRYIYSDMDILNRYDKEFFG